MGGYVTYRPLSTIYMRIKLCTETSCRSINCSVIFIYLKKNLIYRNIFFKKGVIKIADFGVARDLNTQQLFTANVGTKIIMSPEILLNQPYGIETDIWSLGCVFFEIITLEVLYFGETEQILDQIKKQEKLTKLNDDIPIHSLIIKLFK